MPTAAAGLSPPIVLEHGAWADGSSWAGVVGLLQGRGLSGLRAADPLRGLASDSATLADFVKTLTGPVILVGHSYGGWSSQRRRRCPEREGPWST